MKRFDLTMYRYRMPIVRLGEMQQFSVVNLLTDPGFDPVPKPIPQCMEVRLNWTYSGGKIGHNVLHVRYPAAYPGGVTLANTIGNSIGGLLGTSNLLNTLATDVSYHGVSLRDRGVLNGTYSDSVGVIGTGGATGLALPSETAAVLTERTTISGPSGRGRIYLGGFTADGLAAGNVMAPGVVAALTAFANGIISALNVNGLIMCLALPSRIEYTSPKPPFTVHPARSARTQDVTQVVLRDNHWDSQRRRGLK